MNIRAFRLNDRLGHYIKLIRADKPIGSLLLMWPMLWALWIVSDGQPRIDVLFVFILGTFLMRSAGCAINDYADRHIDGSVARTQYRPIVTGAVSPGEALLVAGLLALCSFVLVLSMNRLTILLSVVGLLLAIGYPFSKRVTYWPQMVLGLAFGWAVPMVCAAQTGTIETVGWLIYLAVILWAFAYDTIYAMVDREDDLLLGVKSTAIKLGDKDVAAVAFSLICIFAILISVGLYWQLGIAYFAGLVAGALVVLFQLYLIRSRDPAQCYRAFLASNYMGLFIFAGLVIDKLV